MLLEVCSGCDLASRTGYWASTLCCAALSVQGLSVLMQVRTICPPEMTLRPLYTARALHLPLSLAIFTLLLPERLPRLRIVVSVDPYLLHSLSAHRICSVCVAFAPIASAVQRACPDCIYGCAHGTCPHRICAARIRF